MAFSRRLGVVGILGVSWLVAVGCGDDGDKLKNGGDAGEAGEAPTGGKSTVGGSSNNAGKGGVAPAGKGGMSTGGNGGSSTAGTNAVGGAGGEAGGAGAGGTAEAGAGGVAAGAGGQAGAGGAGGAPVETALGCTYPCTDSNDCAVLPDDASRQCDPIIHQCRTPGVDDGCATNTDCIPQGNFLASCASEQDCNVDLEACVTYRGSGYCAPLADPQEGCDPAFGTKHTVANFGAAGTSDVCVDDTAQACSAGSCIFSCNVVGCDNDGTCNEANGLCECQTADECPTTGVCGADHHCAQCQTSDDCAVSASDTGLDICVDGKCGCSSEASCVNPGFQGAPPVCQ